MRERIREHLPFELRLTSGLASSEKRPPRRGRSRQRLFISTTSPPAGGSGPMLAVNAHERQLGNIGYSGVVSARAIANWVDLDLVFFLRRGNQRVQVGGHPASDRATD